MHSSTKTGYYFDTLVRFATYTLDVILIQKKTKKLVGTNLPSLVSFLLLKKPSLLLQIHLNISVLSEIRQTWQAADIKIMLIILVVLVTRLRFEHIGMYLEEFKILKATGRVALLIAPCGQQLIGIVFLTIMSVVFF